MKRISKRFNTRPGIRKEDVLNLAVAVDTSGSISDHQLCIFFNEIRWVFENGAMITVYEADHDIQAVYSFTGKFTGKVHGRGGTSFEPVLKAVDRQFDALIYFTDGFAGNVGFDVRIPILWVVNSDIELDSFPCKQGKIVKVDEEKGIVESR
jgi:predicted metal-dependent peptidase